MVDYSKDNRMPLVSVVMPSYNKKRFVEETIHSVAGQTYPNWELIIVDDCSTDGTYECLQRLAAADSRIRLYRNEENLGAAKTRNRCLDLASGDYVALLDSDDLWLPEKLERQMLVAKETAADIIYCSYSIIGESGEQVCPDFIVPESTSFEAFLTRSVISCSTAVLTREVAEKYRFDPGYYHEDLALWFQMLQDGCTARGDRAVLARYRMAEGAKSANKIKTAMFRWDIYRNMLGFSVWKSGCLLADYAFRGILKYRRSGG